MTQSKSRRLLYQQARLIRMQKWEYRVKWYNETEEVAKSMCPVESTADPFNLG